MVVAAWPGSLVRRPLAMAAFRLAADAWVEKVELAEPVVPAVVVPAVFLLACSGKEALSQRSIRAPSRQSRPERKVRRELVVRRERTTASTASHKRSFSRRDR
jgi:hypothetical protein